MGHHWISMKKACALTQMPERTLRHKLNIEKIVGKKEGWTWQVDYNDLKAQGLVKITLKKETVEPTPTPTQVKETTPPPAFTQVEEKEVRSPSEKSQKQRRPRPSPMAFSLANEFVSFRVHLVEFFQTHSLIEKPSPAKALNTLDKSLEYFTAGYFEFSSPLKAELYRKTRFYLSQVWLYLELSRDLPEDAKAKCEEFKQQLLSNLLPAISGMIRRSEKGGSPRRKRNDDTMTPAFSGGMDAQ